MDQISRFLPLKNTKVKSLHVAVEPPEAYPDLGRNPAFRLKVSRFLSWAAGAKNIRNALTGAESILYKEGYVPDAAGPLIM